MQAVVLAGGLGTRLSARTERLPKYLIAVAGRPFAAWQLDRLRACGFSEVLLCIGHLGEQIRAALGDGSRFGLTLRYADDGKQLRGTAGALRHALSELPPSFVVTYGDSYLPFDYASPLRDLAAHPEALGTLAVFRNRNRWDRSNVRVAGEQVIEYRKLAEGERADGAFEDIDYGAMALRREAVAALAADRPLGLDAVQADLASRGRLRAYRAERRFFEIGSESGLRALEHELEAHPEAHPSSRASSES